MEGPSPLSCLVDGGMDELVGRIVAANAQGLVVRTFPSHMGTEVQNVTERSLISYLISHG